jgi:hypothetical protein
MGLGAYSELLEKYGTQRKNMQTLDNINRQLEGIKDSLLFDRDSIVVAARGLGYGYPEERFVRIVGIRDKPAEQISVGTIFRPSETGAGGISDKTLRIFAIIVSGALFIFMVLFDLLRIIRDA